MMTIEIDSERSRLRALLMRSHNLAPEDADRRLAEMNLSIHITSDAVDTRAGQAAALTAILLADRCFGHVRVSGDVDHPIEPGLPLGKTIREIIVAIGAEVEEQPTARTIVIGVYSAGGLPCVQTGWDGWRARCVPGQVQHTLGDSAIELAGIAAAALAVGQSFMAELGDVTAGARVQEVSLWQPDATGVGEIGPTAYQLPDSLWLIGLGNLGQAYLWCLSWLAFPDRSTVCLTMQDFDKVGKENWGTSILVQRGRYGMLKTRAAENWATSLGFEVRRVDRALDNQLRRTPAEPAIALAGLDNISVRRFLGLPGFRHVIDAGLGSSVRDFQRFRINVFDATDDASAHFSGVVDKQREEIERVLQLPAYQRHLATSSDGGCGTLTLAGQPIVVPFVSALAAALAITQAIRIASWQSPCRTITGNANDLRSVRVAINLNSALQSA